MIVKSCLRSSLRWVLLCYLQLLLFKFLYKSLSADVIIVYRHVIILAFDDCKKLFAQFVKAGFAVLFTAFIVQISLQIFKC